ncbi:mitochondrial carrier [Meira miltonrushii]|uniref:Mitochondrial carrier n=1 Tax=Meira miltonrushii TaxID=1280837 RepID=A0A316V3B2_9BASI|nr:mitochondrial carrier [Meira miltonrushii]PWN32020.1 mitochondrial carrier [Meira miltonrushii]
MHSDHEGEAGWIGSGVWGLSAVGAKQRQADRERDRRIAKGHVEDDGGRRQRQIEWEGFLRYADQKERELYKIFIELDKNGDMRLDTVEIAGALDRAEIELSKDGLKDFVASLGSSSRWQGSGCPSSVTFPEFRDYLLLLPRKPSVNEIFRFYQVRKAFGLFGSQGIFGEFSDRWGKTERHGATSVTQDGDVSLAGEERKKLGEDEKEARREARRVAIENAATEVVSSDNHSDSETNGLSGILSNSDMIHGDVALKFLLAGGIAGAVSRTATAPFDRLKIYLITTARAQPEALNSGSTSKIATRGMSMLTEAVHALYREGGGLKAFWVGNGLNCLKIFPESAIKFLSYETAKRAFAKYVDGVSDSRDISGTSRFLSGGFGGITSQFAIYPVETLKTRLMAYQGSSGSNHAPAGHQAQGNRLLSTVAKDMWKNGGMRTYYRGLTAGLIGVFPYSAIDMSTFEGIKLFYIKYTGREEPGVLALLAFGSLSGSVGATTVYPLSLVRTRLQAAGTPAHPQQYDGFWHACRITYKQEGFVGFYRGLVPSLAKVVPAVSISYVVYEHSKRRLGVQ